MVVSDYSTLGDQGGLKRNGLPILVALLRPARVANPASWHFARYSTTISA
jgi:hypothetical protein